MLKTIILLAALALALAGTASSSLAGSSPLATATASDDHGRGAEPGDDRGGATEPGDDRGTDAVSSRSPAAKTTKARPRALAKARRHSHARRTHREPERRHGRDG